jgi:hypothetical protein
MAGGEIVQYAHRRALRFAGAVAKEVHEDEQQRRVAKDALLPFHSEGNTFHDP